MNTLDLGRATPDRELRELQDVELEQVSGGIDPDGFLVNLCLLGVDLDTLRGVGHLNAGLHR
jgi:hypothetical protein